MPADTFGLYNPDRALSPKPNGRRALTSTSGTSAALVAGKDKEIVRLTSSLAASQSSLASLNAKLADTANSLSTAQRDLRRSEAKTVSAEEKISRLERRFEGVKVLQNNFEALRAEHEKSKAAREKELARVSEALVDKEAACKVLAGDLEAAKEAFGELAWQASKAVKGRIAANNRFITDTHDVLVLEAHLQTASAENQAADQAAQVSALAATVRDLEDRLDDADKDAKAAGRDSRVPWRHLRQAEELRASARRDDVDDAAFLDAAAQDLFSLLLSRTALLDKELASSQQRSAILEAERFALFEEKTGLEGALGEALALNDTFLKSIKSLRSEVGSLETQLTGLRSVHEKLEHAHSTTVSELEEERRQMEQAKEAWQGERDGLVGEIREKEKERVKEADARQRLAKALGISRQAETALKEELQECVLASPLAGRSVADGGSTACKASRTSSPRSAPSTAPSNGPIRSSRTSNPRRRRTPRASPRSTRPSSRTATTRKRSRCSTGCGAKDGRNARRSRTSRAGWTRRRGRSRG